MQPIHPFQRSLTIALLVSLIFGLSACNSSGSDSTPPEENPNGADIVDPDAFYDEDGYEVVDVIRVDIKTVTTAGICTLEDESGCTLADVLADTNGQDEFNVEIPIHFSSTDFPDDGLVSNASLRQRGNSSRLGAQKSFRIKLDSRDDLWRNERRLQLNKHPFETSRIRNKLSFDLMRTIPNLPSMRTQFVNLWIDDGNGPVDQGLYTHVEYGGKEYLANRDRDTDDNLYKIEHFTFSAEPDLQNVQVDETGAPIDEDRFELSLDPKRGDDHSKLVEMLTAMSDSEQSFESVFEMYFNQENVLTWMTTNFLLHQVDAVTHNFYLYNPIGSNTFYFLPWDYDGTFHSFNVLTESYENEDLGRRLYYGYASAFNSQFHSRYLRMPGIHGAILEKANELRQSYLSDATIDDMARRYSEIVRPYASSSPDVDSNPNYTGNYAGFSNAVAANHLAMQTQFSVPLPHKLSDPTAEGTSQTLFSWTPAYDVTQSGTISYELDIASSIAFEPDSIVVSIPGIADSEDMVSQVVDNDLLPDGQLYYRVTARVSSDPTIFWQVASNDVLVGDTTWFGLQEFSFPLEAE